MARYSLPLLLGLLCACSDPNSADTLGQGDITAQGTIHFERVSDDVNCVDA